MNKSFCVLPFYRTVVRTNGSLAPCCAILNYDNIKNTSIESFWKSDRLTQLRKNMLEGNLCSDCEVCYEEERQYGKSMRTESHRDHLVNDHTDLNSFVNNSRYLDRNFPNHLELHAGNLCNLKCLMCKPQDSSSFLAEDKILKISNFQQQNFQISDSIVETTVSTALNHGIEVLDLRGGESMLVPSIRKVIQSLPQNHGIKCLRLQTNCTILDDFWKQAFQQFETVELMMSIDAYGAANDYIRYPSKWEEIERNVDYFVSCNNTKFYINCTVSNLNVLILRPLIDWCKAKNIYLHYSFCSDPDFYHYTNLPEPLFELALSRLQDWNGYNSLIGMNANNKHWDKFCQMINIRDKHRNNSIFDVVPEFKFYWKDL